MAIFDGLGLPASVTGLVEMAPVEDLVLAIIHDGLPDVPCFSLISQTTGDMEFFIIARRSPYTGTWDGDPRFIDHANVSVNVFCKGADADMKAALISEAVRVVIRDAAKTQKVYPGIGHLMSARMNTEPARQPDWASSTGPVQYADLPAGFQRYQSNWTLKIRRPTN